MSDYHVFGKMKYHVDPKKGEFSRRDASPPPTAKEANDTWAEMIHRRYSPYAPILNRDRLQEVGNAMLSDMGIGDYKIRYGDMQSLRDEKKGGPTGVFSKDNMSIDIDSGMLNKRAAWAPVTLFHEGAHAADFASDPGGFQRVGLEPQFDPKAKPGDMHFLDYRNRADLMQVLGEQQKIEQGQEPNKKMLLAYPWLREVNPLSTNLLAGPWRERLKEPTAFDSEAWNRRAMAAWGMPQGLTVYGRIRKKSSGQ